MGKKKSKTRGAPSSSASVAAVAVSQADIVDACRARDLVKLRRWGREGVRVTDGLPLMIAVDAVKDGNDEVLRCLVTDLGADLNQRDANGFTPLHFAAHDNNLDCIRCLVTEYGADVNQASRNGATPAYLAAQNGQLTCSDAW
jgi:ankyrin repeat protein